MKLDKYFKEAEEELKFLKAQEELLSKSRVFLKEKSESIEKKYRKIMLETPEVAEYLETKLLQYVEGKSKNRKLCFLDDLEEEFPEKISKRAKWAKEYLIPTEDILHTLKKEGYIKVKREDITYLEHGEVVRLTEIGRKRITKNAEKQK